jgi:hypothetical protein
MTSASGFGREEGIRTTSIRASRFAATPEARMIALLVAAATSLSPHNNSVLAETQPCRPMEYERNPYKSMSTDRIAKDAAGVFELMFQVFKHQLELDEIERTNCALAKLGWGPTP